MTSDDFVSAVDGLVFDENGRTWTLEVDDVDDSQIDMFSVTIRVPEAEGELYFDAPRNRDLDTAALQDHIVGLARELVSGRVSSGIRTAL